MDNNKQIDIIEKKIAIIMRIGVVASLFLMLFGLVLTLINTNTDIDVVTASDISVAISALSQLNPYSYMLLGIFILILTPIVRVISCIILFKIEKDIVYTLITCFVLVILILSFIVGFIH